MEQQHQQQQQQQQQLPQPSQELKQFWIEDALSFKTLSKEAQQKMVAWTQQRNQSQEDQMKLINELFQKADLNQNGKLDLKGFGVLCKELENMVRDQCGDAATLTEEQVAGRFKAYDLQKRGFIGKDDLVMSEVMKNVFYANWKSQQQSKQQ